MNQQIKRIISVLMAGAITMAFVPQERLAPNMVNAVAAPSFYDVEGHQHESAIMRWALLGVVLGDNGMFYPDSQATRVEFLATMNRVLGVAVSRRTQVFNDVTTSDWFYDEVQKAYAAGLTIGVGNDMFAPKQILNREMMITLMGRIFGLYSENTSILTGIYADETSATYGRGYLAAFAEMGVTMAIDGNFEPLRIVTRAEMFQFISDFLPTVLSATDNLSGKTTNGNVLIRTPGVIVDNMTLNGSLILGDGVENGNITLRNCKINGRLIIRGGGPNSVNLTGTTVSEGVYVYNTNCYTRIYNTNVQSKIGEVTAMTGVTLEGPGFSTLHIPIDALDNSGYVLRDVTLDSLNVERANTSVRLESVAVDNIRFAASAYNSNLNIDEEAYTNYLEIGGDDIVIQGEGDIDYLVINGNNANVSMDPRFVSIAPGLTAIVDGEEIKGSEVGNASNTISNVTRSTPEMEIKRDAGNTGGTGMTLATSNIANGNLVTITPDASAVQMTDQSRLGYWIGFLIPAPPKAQDPAVKIGYTFEGSNDFAYSIPNVSQNNIKGILVYIPVKAKSDLTGTIDTTLDITWGNGLYERLTFKGNNFKLAQASSSQITRMVNQYGNANYPSYNKIATFTGSEALKRLLLADNALGLDTRSFDVFEEKDKNSFVSQMYTDRASLTSKPAIQNYLNSKITSVGGLYLINGVMTAAELQKILEDDGFAGQLGINTLKGSDYDNLSAYGKLNVANAMLIARNALAGGKFANEEAVAAEFDKQVAARRKIEVTLLSTINNTADATAMQKLYENKTNAEIIGIVVASDPYKTMVAAQKANVAAKVVAGRQFVNLDAVRKIFEGLVGTPDKPVVLAPEDNPNITGVSADPSTINLVVGATENFLPIISTSSGSYSNFGAVTMTIANSNIALLDASKGLLTGKAKGKTTVTILSAVDKKKKATVTVNVVDPVTITALSISPPSVSVNVNSYVQLTLNVTPKTGNDKVFWSSDNAKIATVSNGLVQGISPGYTNVTAYTASGIKAKCTIFVSDTKDTVTIDKTDLSKDGYIEIGIDCVYKLKATVSPISQSNTNVYWKSDDISVATVDSNGSVIGRGEGITEVTATSAATGVTDKIKIKVSLDRYGVIISNNKLTMYKKGIYQLSATVQPNNTIRPDDGSDILWSVENDRTDIVKVDNKGLVTAVGPGTAYVTASYKNDPSGRAFDRCEITVLADELVITTSLLPTSLKSPPSIKAGDTFYIQVSFKPTPDNTIVDFSSSAPLVATVDQNGKVTGVGAGTAVIYIKPQANNSVIQLAVTVSNVAITSFSVNPSTVKILKGQELQLSALFTPDNVTNKGVDWSSSDPSVVSVVPGTGYIKGLQPTTTTTIATKTGLVKNDNYDPREMIQVSTISSIDGTSTITSIPNDKYDAREYINGIITETSTSTKLVTITATSKADNTKKATCVVTVDERTGVGEVNKIDIQMDVWVFQVGTTQKLKVDFNGDPQYVPITYGITWTSSAPGVASVDSNGYLKALKPGEASITATSEDGAKKSVKKIVVAAVGVESITFSGTEPDSNIYGDWVKLTTKPSYNTRQLSAYVDPDGIKNDADLPATDRSVAWTVTSTPSGVVSVSQTGLVTANKAGVAKVTVTANQKLAYSSEKLTNPNVNLEKSGIKYDNATGKYYDPNGNEIDPDDLRPVVVNQDVKKTFMVWVTDPLLENISFQNLPTEFTAGTAVTLSAQVSPSTSVETGKCAKVNRVIWEITNPSTGEVIRTGDNGTSQTDKKQNSSDYGVSSNGITFFTFTPPVNSSNLIVRCTAYMDEFSPTEKITTMDNGEVKVEAVIKATQNATVPVKTIPVDAITSIAVSYNGTAVTTGKITLGKELPYTLSANISPSNASNKNVHWSSSNENVATISSISGAISPIATTTSVTFTATSAYDATITKTITLEIDSAPTANSITRTISPSLFSMTTSAATTNAVTASTTARTATAAAATAVPINITKQTLQLVSQRAEQVLEKDDTPVMPTYIRLRGGSAKVLVGRTLKLYPILKPTNANMLAWQSSDESIATVDGNGVVTGKKTGDVKITAMSSDGSVVSNECRVFVVDSNPRPTEKLKLSRSNLKMFIGQDVTLDTTVTPKDGSMKGLNWYSSNPEVATVSAGGKIIAVNGGTCTITAVTDDGKKAYCTISVKVRVKSITLNTRSLTIKVGGDEKLVATVAPSNASTNYPSWKSDNEKVATVSADGTVKAHSRGEAKITATCDGRNITCTVTVID